MSQIPASASILVVDDQPVALALAQTALARLGYTNVEKHLSALEACEALRHKRFDLVLSDWHMPRMDGPAFYRQIAIMLGSRRPRFFFLTADNGWASHVACRELGADGLLIKPARATDLIGILARAVH